jgi:hypothetical protein
MTLKHVLMEVDSEHGLRWVYLFTTSKATLRDACEDLASRHKHFHQNYDRTRLTYQGRHLSLKDTI